MTSKEMKGYLLRYYRFKRNMITGTEVSIRFGICDVLTMTFAQKNSTEIEIKTSLADLKNDFKNKKPKHMPKNREMLGRPNYFYFAFPVDMKVPNDIIPEEYGIIRIDPCINEHIIFERNAKRLNNNHNSSLFDSLVHRISSELVTWYDKVVLGSQEIPDWLEHNNEKS